MESGEVNYFFDSYAVAEILHGNLNYKPYVEEPVFITIFNLAEIYWIAIHEYSQKEADKIYDKYADAVQEIDDETLQEAMKFRKENKKKNLSYADCVGYVYALKNKMKFLTGDKEFENFKNVEFAR